MSDQENIIINQQRQQVNEQKTRLQLISSATAPRIRPQRLAVVVHWQSEILIPYLAGLTAFSESVFTSFNNFTPKKRIYNPFCSPFAVLTGRVFCTPAQPIADELLYSQGSHMVQPITLVCGELKRTHNLL